MQYKDGLLRWTAESLIPVTITCGFQPKMVMLMAQQNNSHNQAKGILTESEQISFNLRSVYEVEAPPIQFSCDEGFCLCIVAHDNTSLELEGTLTETGFILTPSTASIVEDSLIFWTAHD